MAKSKTDLIKEGDKLAGKARAAGLEVTALTKVVARLNTLQLEKEELRVKLDLNKENVKLVWKALKAELKGLQAEIKAAREPKALQAAPAKAPATTKAPAAKRVPAAKGAAKKSTAPKPAGGKA